VKKVVIVDDEPNILKPGIQLLFMCHVTIDLYSAAFPLIACSLAAMMLIMLFPALALWMPSLMSN